MNEKLALIYDAITKLTNNFSDLSDTIVAQINEIIELVKNGNISLEEALRILNSIKDDTSEGNKISKDLLAAINKLGLKIDQHDTNASELLEKILAAIEKNTEADKVNTQAIIDAINKLGGDVITALNKLLERTDVDFDKLMAKLQEILEAIKDHNVTVEVNTEVTCHCDCGKCNNPNEGIIGDLNDLLNARGYTFDDSDTTGIISIQEMMNSKKPVYALNGMRINPNQMKKGDIYIIDGKKFVAK